MIRRRGQREGSTHRISGGMRGGFPNAVKDALENLGLFGLGGNEQFIPACYMLLEYRSALGTTRGLMIAMDGLRSFRPSVSAAPANALLLMSRNWAIAGRRLFNTRPSKELHLPW